MGFVVRYRFLWYDSFSLGSEPRLYPTPPTLPPQTQIWPGSDVSSPPWYTLTPKNLMEMSLANDGLCSALSLPLVRQFFIEIWTTTVSHSPAQIPQTQIWTGSDVIPPLPNTPRHPETWWKELSWWWAFQFTIGCNIMRVYHSNTRGYANDVVPIYRKILHFYKI